MYRKMLLCTAAMSFALIGWLALAALNSPTANAAARSEVQSTIQPRRAANALAARRLISVPFGIDSTLMINRDGGGVRVVGHGDCPAGGGDLHIRAMVIQNTSGSIATGVMSGSCTGAPQIWRADATTWGQFLFEKGQAQACAVAVVKDKNQQGAIAYQWCKDVTLQ